MSLDLFDGIVMRQNCDEKCEWWLYFSLCVTVWDRLYLIRRIIVRSVSITSSVFLMVIMSLSVWDSFWEKRGQFERLSSFYEREMRYFFLYSFTFLLFYSFNKQKHQHLLKTKSLNINLNTLFELQHCIWEGSVPDTGEWVGDTASDYINLHSGKWSEELCSYNSQVRRAL